VSDIAAFLIKGRSVGVQDSVHIISSLDGVINAHRSSVLSFAMSLSTTISGSSTDSNKMVLGVVLELKLAPASIWAEESMRWRLLGLSFIIGNVLGHCSAATSRTLSL
jgi:hypothetical protein